MLEEAMFNGSCDGWTNFKIGVLKAPSDPYTFASNKWIDFRYVKNLIVGGPGIWMVKDPPLGQQMTAKKNPNCHTLPITMTFDLTTNTCIL